MIKNVKKSVLRLLFASKFMHIVNDKYMEWMRKFENCMNDVFDVFFLVVGRDNYKAIRHRYVFFVDKFYYSTTTCAELRFVPAVTIT